MSHRLPHQQFFARTLPVLKRLVWQRLRPAHRRAVARALGCFAARAQGAPPALPVYVAGFLSAATGQGEGARLTIGALRALGYPVHGIDVGPMLAVQDFASEGASSAMAAGPGTVIFHFNPEGLVFSLLAAGRAALRGKRIIGYWAWETARIPPFWAAALSFLDEVWAPSRFTADAIGAVTSKPVRVVPHPVAIRPPGRARRAEFGMGAEFTVLAMASFQSTFDRKNPLAAIDAFRLAFGDDKGARLVLKLAHGDADDSGLRALIDARIAGASNIRVLDATLDGAAARDLIASADVFLSLHRSEGFGLPLAEAMQAGTAVIATAWSGNLDFMDDACAALVPATLVPALDTQGFFTDGTVTWAEPSLRDAAAWLVRLRADPQLRAAMAAHAQRRVADALGLAGFARAVAQGLPPP